MNLNPWTVGSRGSRSREQEEQEGEEKWEEEERGRRRSRRPAMVTSHCERESGTGLMIDLGAGRVTYIRTGRFTRYRPVITSTTGAFFMVRQIFT